MGQTRELALRDKWDKKDFMEVDLVKATAKDGFGYTSDDDMNAKLAGRLETFLSSIKHCGDGSICQRPQ